MGFKVRVFGITSLSLHAVERVLDLVFIGLTWLRNHQKSNPLFSRSLWGRHVCWYLRT